MKKEYKKNVEEFLKIKNIAIAGYSTKNSQPANHIYKRLHDNGYNVFAVNPKSNLITDVKCFESIKAISEPVEGVVICTPSIVTASVIRECISLNIKHIWMHRTFDDGSYSEHAYEICKENGINCIPIGCPMMFINADFPHKCMKWFLDFSGKFNSN